MPFPTPLPSATAVSGGVHERQNRKKVSPREPAFGWYTYTVYCAVVKMLLLGTILCGNALIHTSETGLTQLHFSGEGSLMHPVSLCPLKKIIQKL